MSAGTASMDDGLASARSARSSRGDHRIDRQHDLAAGLLRPRQDLARGVVHLGFLQRLADANALRGEEGVGHRAADHQHVDCARPGCRAGRAWSRPWRRRRWPPPAATGCRAPRPAPPAPPASAARHRPAAGARRPRCWHGRDGRRRRRRSRRDRRARRAPPANSGSFFSSPGDGSACSPAPARRRRSAARPPARPACPTQSSAKRTSLARAPRRAPPPPARSDIPGTRLPFGRSKWLQTITCAPLSDSSRMVGDSRSMPGAGR